MSGEHKLDWVKESFELFIQRVRDQDFVSLVVFDDIAETRVPLISLATPGARERLREAVSELNPRGGTDLTVGLQQGYQEVMANYRQDYTNRVLFLTDGMGNHRDILSLAAGYRDIGVNVSTIGVGTGFDLQLMMDIARTGGGSSRFIANQEEMKNIFSAELDRMVVPAAREVEITLTLSEGVDLIDTWGYEHTKEGSQVRYSLPTLHNRDYETILARVQVSGEAEEESRELGRLSGSYKTLAGEKVEVEERILRVDLEADQNVVDGYSDAMVLRSGSVLDYAQDLQQIGEIWYQADSETGVDVQMLSQQPRDEELLTSLAERTRQRRNRMLLVQEQLGEAIFEKEVGILDNYLEIFTQELGWESADLDSFRNDRQLPVRLADVSTFVQIENLFDELGVRLSSEYTEPGKARLAMADFHFQTTVQYDRSFYTLLTSLIQETGRNILAQILQVTLLSSQEIESYMTKGSVSAQDMLDTTKARSVGIELTSNAIVTGTLIEMGSGFVLFARLIDVDTGEILSSAQVVVDKEQLLQDILG